jgi:hypothetical protein
MGRVRTRRSLHEVTGRLEEISDDDIFSTNKEGGQMSEDSIEIVDVVVVCFSWQ